MGSRILFSIYQEDKWKFWQGAGGRMPQRLVIWKPQWNCFYIFGNMPLPLPENHKLKQCTLGQDKFLASNFYYFAKKSLISVFVQSIFLTKHSDILLQNSKKHSYLKFKLFAKEVLPSYFYLSKGIFSTFQNNF